MTPGIFILIVAVHFFASLFMHSFYLHRYGTHGQFTMSRFWERFFYVLTFVLQGLSFLNPKAYAQMHLQHHEHSDQPQDPHSPLNFSKSKYGLDVGIAGTRMMLFTRKIYSEILHGKHAIAHMYKERTFPNWQAFAGFANSTIGRLCMGIVVVVLYALFVPVWWCWFLLPITLLNGAIQGAIVNWFGHMWGYRNFKLGDNSKNTWLLSTVMLGELFQNNHHQSPDNPNFAHRWFEFDPIYPAILIMDKLRIIRLKKQ